MTDRLRQRLRAANPVPVSAPVEPADSPGTRAMMEAIMQTQPQPASRTPTARPRWVPALGAAAAVAAVATGGILLANRPDPQGAADALQLSLPGAGSMAMCIPFSVDALAEMTPAFAATATDVTEDRVVLDVDRWYAGGDASQVVLEVPVNTSLHGEIDFEEGARYLVTASQGTVNLCGFSGEATPELEAAFEEAF